MNIYCNSIKCHDFSMLSMEFLVETFSRMLDVYMLHLHQISSFFDAGFVLLIFL